MEHQLPLAQLLVVITPLLLHIPDIEQKIQWIQIRLPSIQKIYLLLVQHIRQCVILPKVQMQFSQDMDETLQLAKWDLVYHQSMKLILPKVQLQFSQNMEETLQLVKTPYQQVDTVEIQLLKGMEVRLKNTVLHLNMELHLKQMKVHFLPPDMAEILQQEEIQLMWMVIVLDTAEIHLRRDMAVI